MRHVVVTAALGGALFLAGAAGAEAWEGRGDRGPGPVPVADYHDGPRHDGGQDRGRHDGGYGGPRHDHHGDYGHGPRHGFYEPPRPRCWIRPTYWGPEKVCR